MPNVTPLFLDIRENVMANRHFMPNPMMGMAMAAKAAGAAPMEARVLADSAPVRLEAEQQRGQKLYDITCVTCRRF